MIITVKGNFCSFRGGKSAMDTKKKEKLLPFCVLSNNKLQRDG